MVDLEKTSTSIEPIKSELRELAVTNQNLHGELETVRHKLNNELDVLTVRLDKIAYETEEIRREVRDINRTIDKLRYDLMDAIRNSKKSESSDLLTNLFPLVAMGLPVLFLMIVVIVKVVKG